MDRQDPEARFLCRTCGEYHEGPPLSYRFEAPDPWYALPEKDEDGGSELTDEICIINDEHFFVLGNIVIPVIGSQEMFQWTVWVSLSRSNFDRTIELWEDEGRETDPPYFGWLSNDIPVYPDTFALKTNVHTQPVGIRPLIELEPTDHPLAVEQREGITWQRVQEIAEAMLHSEAENERT